MLKKYRAHIIFGLVVALSVGILVASSIYDSVPRLSRMTKDKIKEDYFVYECGSNERIYKMAPIIWYEENNYTEEENVWRYIGTYGDCYAFLVIGSGIGATMDPLELPVKLQGLSRTVYYPNDAHVMLYHTKRLFTYQEAIYPNSSYEKTIKMASLDEIENREEWLTDAQLEQLTRDIEKMAAGRV